MANRTILQFGRSLLSQKAFKGIHANIRTGRSQAILCLSTEPATDIQPASAPEVVIRTLRRHEVAYMDRLWASQGVDIGEDHMNSVLALVAPVGYYVACVNGKIMGSCVHVAINDEVGLQGGLIALEECRSLGIARHVCSSGRRELLGDRNLAADSVPHMADTYRRWGYVHTAHTNVIYGGALKKDSFLNSKAPSLPEGYSMVNQMDVDFRKLDEFDQTIHPAGSIRTTYMKWLLDRESTLGYAIVDKDGEVQGLGARISSKNGRFNMGPLYCRDNASAEVLLRQLVSETPEGADCDMMAPEENEKAVELMRALGLEETWRSVRLYTKGVVDMPLQHMFSYTNVGFAGFLLC